MDKHPLSVEEQIQLLLGGDAHNQPCDECEVSQVDLDFPPWFDEQKFKKGQKKIQENLMAQLGIALTGLLCVLSVPSILKILIQTQKSSTFEGAYRRYASTAKHVYKWYTEELSPGSVVWKSLTAVRTRHLKNSKNSNKKGMGIISQRDLSLTLFGFYGLGILEPQKVGLDFSKDEDLEAYIHFWRTIGYMMGIQDRYNLCRPSIQETLQVNRYLQNDVYKSLLINPPEYFYHMTNEMLEGMWYLDPSIDKKCFMYFVYWLAGIPGFTDTPEKNISEQPEYKKLKYSFDGLFSSENDIKHNILDPVKLYSSLGWFQRFSLYMMFLIHQSWLFTAFGRWYYNMRVKITIFCTDYFPYLAIWKFGIKRAYVDIFTEDISIPGTLKTNKEILDVLYSKE